jgi:uncharacterized protein YjbJ (UPF0337 family)
MLSANRRHGKVSGPKRLKMEVTQMNDDILAGKWKQVKGNVRQWWGQLTDDDVNQMTGKTEELAGKLQERYGWTRERANAEIKHRLAEMDTETTHAIR